MLKFLRLFALLLIGSHSIAQNPAFTSKESWVDSVFSSMSHEEKIGQLFMIATWSNRGEDHQQEVEELITKYHIGGLIFFQGGPVRQVNHTNYYQSLARIPLWIGMDLEWGLGMRLDSTISFPKQMTLGAIQDDQLIYEMGYEIARQMKLIGVHMNYAPVVDVNSNPMNPVIGFRSFGENKFKVAEKGIQYMQGMQDNGVMATAKHFPGHGDTDKDSHLTLPVIKHKAARMDSLELYPFYQLFDRGIMSTMVAHISVPSLDNNPRQPTTLSYKVVNGLLKNKMNFKGVVFTDAMNMKGIADRTKPGDADLKALMAGNDVLLYSIDIPKAVDRISRAVLRKQINQIEIDSRVKKVLSFKYDLGLHRQQNFTTNNLLDNLNSPDAKALRLKLFEEAVTVVKNENNLLPFTVLDTLHFASLSINTNGETTFQKTLNTYAPFQHYIIKDIPVSDDAYADLLDKLEHFDVVVAGIHNMSQYQSRGFGLREPDMKFLKELNRRTRVVLVVFGNPYSLKNFSEFDNIIITYEDTGDTEIIGPEVIFGAIEAKGKLPVTASKEFIAGQGIVTRSLQRLGYDAPENQGMDSRVLQKIDQIAHEAIENGATPGCEVLIARNGRIIYDKTYGHFSYDSLKEVNNNTIYDLASITKVTATLQTVMFLYGQGLMDLDKKAASYLPELKATNKKDMIIRDILTHQAGLWPFVPFWRKTQGTKLDSIYYRNEYSKEYSIQIAPNLYALNSLQDSLWKWTLNARVRDKTYRKPYDYTYSDMGYYILQKISERLLNQSMPDFLDQNFYAPMGMNSMGFLPLCRFPEDIIAPTEFDTSWRLSHVRGMVHDQGAALYGGVAGHAGLFSNANDLAKIMQMNLQGGNYGGIKFLEPGVIQSFITKQYMPSRRGIGWDKPTDNAQGPTSRYASFDTFGHTGFTGTATWADPEFGLVYVFLSNRINPSAENRILLDENIRSRIHDIVYESIWSYRRSFHQNGETE